MVKKLSAADLQELQSKGSIIKKKPQPKVESGTTAKPKPIPTENSSIEMKAAVAAAQRAAEAAVQTSQVANGLMQQTIEANKALVADIVEVMKGNQVIKAVINRGMDSLITDVDFIRETT